MKLGKAAGVCEVAAEHMVGMEVRTKIANRVLEGEGIPDDWRYIVIVRCIKAKGM